MLVYSLEIVTFQLEVKSKLSFVQVFMDEVRQQVKIAVIRSFLKLYSSISIQKLAGFMNMSESELRTHLMTFKHKMKNLVWSACH